MTALPEAFGGPLRGEPITYRQADHWLRRFPHLFSAAARDTGSGNARDLTTTDVDRLRRMARLTHAGLRPAAAASIAAHDGEYQRLTDHVTVRVSA